MPNKQVEAFKKWRDFAAWLKNINLQRIRGRKFPRAVILPHMVAYKTPIAKAARASVWGGQDLLIEFDEPFPYAGRPNPRRSEWMHESWIEEIRLEED
jgi:hypothetical protein